ncbi:MAG: carbamoyltransferase [Roseivivax sp.]|nr:carbamoyltransferase [Roseivivax sp.]
MSEPVTILGLSALYHDSAAALVRDGQIVAAAQEERFSRVKHDRRFPVNAINYCLEAGMVEPDELTAVVFYDDPVLTTDRIVRTLAHSGDKGLAQWLKSAPGLLGAKMRVPQLVAAELGANLPVLFTEHHQSHAASAFFPSPFDDAAILTIDGVGEWATTTLGHGSGNQLQIEQDIHFPHSLGLLYSAFTVFTGFKVNSGEYKLMGLAPYGQPIYAGVIRDNLIDIRPDGSFRLNLDYFGYLDGEGMTNERFAALFGGPPRQAESRITQREMDMAASIQQVTEEAVMAMARHLKTRTGAANLCMAGGVALNCVANGKLLASGLFDNIWVQPAAGDAGGALGAALLVAHHRHDAPRAAAAPGRDRQQGSYLGPELSNEEIAAYLDFNDYPAHRVTDDERASRVAAAMAEGKVIGWCVGRMEYGPRALGARSILGDPRSAQMQSAMNLKIKFRESFRPFAPAVLRDKVADWFEMDADSPYMLMVAPVRPELRIEQSFSTAEDLRAIVNRPRSTIPAVTHVDYSARVQTVDGVDKPDYSDLIAAFDALTGCPVIVNTSFNVRGEPIVCTVQDAYRCFMRTDMDVLVLENFVLFKDEQPAFADSQNWRDEFELD